MAWTKKILIPNRYDCLYLVLGILCFLAAVTSTIAYVADRGSRVPLLLDGWIFLVVAIGSCMFAIGAVVGLERASWRRVRVLVGGVAAIPVLSWIGFAVLKGTPTVLTVIRSPRTLEIATGDQATNSHVSVGMVWSYFVFATAAIAGWLLFRIISKGPRRIKEFVTGRFKITRARVLIGVAGVLFLVAVVNNLVELVVPGFKIAFADAVVLGAAIVLQVGIQLNILYFSTRFLLGDFTGWFKSLVFGLSAILVVGAMCFFWPPLSLNVFQWLGGGFLTVVLYGLSLIVVADSNRGERGDSVDCERTASMESKSGIRRMPCIWTIVFLLMLSGTILFPFRYDVTTLLLGQGMVAARNESTLRWNSKGQIWHDGYRNEVLVFDFDESTDPGVLRLLENDVARNIVFLSVSEQIDFSGIDLWNLLDIVWLSGGTVTLEQLVDLISNTSNEIVFDGVDLAKTGRLIDPGLICQFSFVVGENGHQKVGNILAVFETLEDVLGISIKGNIAAEDWAEVVRASRQTSVEIDGELPHGVNRQEMGLAVGDLEMPTFSFRSLTRNKIEWLEATNIAHRLKWGGEAEFSNVFCFDLSFAYPNRLRYCYGMTVTGILDLRNSQIRDYVVFDRNFFGAPIGLCIPLGECTFQIDGMPNLTTLSFDERWIQQRVEYSPNRSLFFDLSKLTKLEQLAFSSTSRIEELDFLSGMSSLKQLQIPVVGRSSESELGFDSCPGLEIITLFGKPDKVSINEFKRLPNLKKLTIVDVDDDFAALVDSGSEKEARDSGWMNRDEFLEVLESRLPDVEITIVDENDFTPDIPESYLAFRKRNQILARRKLRDQAVE